MIFPRPKMPNFLANTRSSQQGRTSPGPNPGSNSSSQVFEFTDTIPAGATRSYPLSRDGDFTTLSVSVTVTPTGNTGTPDILNALQQFNILQSGGNVVNMVPVIDFYLFAQRFGPKHSLPSVVEANGANPATQSIVLYGLSLPVSRGPYTLQIQTSTVSQFVSAGGTATTALNIVVTVTAQVGKAVGLAHYVYSGLPFTPAANGVNDLAPLAPIQDTSLVELFLTGLTSNTADIQYLQILGSKGLVGGRVLATDLVGIANGDMYSPLPSTVLFPLFSLKSNIEVGRTQHLYIQWGATPSASIRLGFYWLS